MPVRTVVEGIAAAVPAIAAPAVPHRGPLPVRRLPDLLFLTVVVGGVVRLVDLNSALCWELVPLIALLAVGYVAGLALRDRLGRWGRPVWFGALLALWCRVSWEMPTPAATAYTWLALPLAILALRMFTGRTALAVVGVITVPLVLLIARTTGTVHPEQLLPPTAALWATVALYRAQQRLLGELRRTRAELARGQREAGRLAERARIARDLHDTLAQELAGSRMLLQAADRDWDRRPDLARAQVRTVVDALDTNLAETRTIISDLTPPALEHDDLSTALRTLCTRTTATSSRVVFRTEGEPGDLPHDRAAALLRVAQGLLANACEHARARHVWVTLDHRDDTTVTVEVRDDGVGFDTRATTATRCDRGLGLTGGRERLGALGGSLTVRSAPGRGTLARASLPVGSLALAGPAGDR
ncbi:MULTISPECIES: sensor histidine kinase [Streptomyces]|uniref:Oxygen sensor histidine kinase NreB n=1 Tax=Streptomyces stelliscabiei TaxID=146820 RepID=A0A8I0PDD7_9ACTN|nr:MULTISPECIES: sensor histidine kinase [Streptomyces]KND42643.1 histidine kinase [Streptomyces stelliscabiei]MBE1602097.1 signal transduction histidine kinase [Streptomyces stelliscabiei]MDX2514309.1 sensor histidine kinase [Streptomyces stelliscabiei]